MIAARLARIVSLLSDLDTFAPRLWSDAPSYRLATPLTEVRLAAAEQAIGVVLPDDYRGFLRTVGTAGPGPDNGLAGLDGWAMPAELPRVTTTLTTVAGDTFTAGTGDRPALPGTPDPARPFPLTTAWSAAEPSTLDIPDGGHLYDGCLHLNDIGCGYSSFLVVTGPERGIVWVDYSAGDGDIAPVAPFLDWYETWLDGCATALLSQALGTTLDRGGPGEYETYLHRWSGCFERMAATGVPQARADLAALRLYQGRRAEARRLIDELEALERSDLDDALTALTGWADPAALAAATGSRPDPAVVLASPSGRIRRLLAANPACPPDALDGLARGALARSALARESVHELDLVARNPSTAPSTVGLLAGLDGPLTSVVAAAAARHPALPAGLVAGLAGSPWPWVRAAVAGHPQAPVARLSADPHPAVRAAVAARTDALPDLLSALAADAVPAVRAAVAGNPAAPTGVLRRLGAEEEDAVAYRLARNPALPDEVRAVLRDHPGQPLPDPPYPDGVEVPDGTRSIVELTRAGAVADSGFPRELLAAIIADPDPMRGYAAGRSPWLDDELLAALATHPYAYARLFVLSHPSPPAELVVTLAHDPVPMVVRAALARPEVPAEFAVEVAQHEDAEHRWGAAENPNLPPDWLRRLADDPDVYVRRAVLTNPNTPAEVVARLAVDAEVLLRIAAGRRTDLDGSTVERLLADPEPNVVRAARWLVGRRQLLG